MEKHIKYILRKAFMEGDFHIKLKKIAQISPSNDKTLKRAIK
jgi:hypothetical protein